MELVEEARQGIAEENGKGSRYFVTDICDGMAQGHDGINYSLVSRDIISQMIEIHGSATPFDGGVFIASCDKGLPGNLMGVGKLNIPSIVMTGGVMEAGPDYLTLEHMGKYSAMYQRGEITKEKFEYYKTQRLPVLRRLLVHGDGRHHAGHGRGPGAHAAGKRAASGDLLRN